MSFMDDTAFVVALERGVRFTQAKLRDSRPRKQHKQEGSSIFQGRHSR